MVGIPDSEDFYFDLIEVQAKLVTKDKILGGGISHGTIEKEIAKSAYGSQGHTLHILAATRMTDTLRDRIPTETGVLILKPKQTYEWETKFRSKSTSHQFTVPDGLTVAIPLPEIIEEWLKVPAWMMDWQKEFQ